MGYGNVTQTKIEIGLILWGQGWKWELYKCEMFYTLKVDIERLGLASLYNSISNPIGYFMTKPSLLEQQR